MSTDMNKKDIYAMTDEELLVEKKNMNKSTIFHALIIGFLGGVLAFGIVAWAMSSKKHIGFLIPMLIPIIFIYKLLKKPNINKELEALLKQRGL